jgi:hypothetical protein
MFIERVNRQRDAIRSVIGRCDGCERVEIRAPR